MGNIRQKEAIRYAFKEGLALGYEEGFLHWCRLMELYESSVFIAEQAQQDKREYQDACYALATVNRRGWESGARSENVGCGLAFDNGTAHVSALDDVRKLYDNMVDREALRLNEACGMAWDFGAEQAQHTITTKGLIAASKMIKSKCEYCGMSLQNGKCHNLHCEGLAR